MSVNIKSYYFIFALILLIGGIVVYKNRTLLIGQKCKSDIGETKIMTVNNKQYCLLVADNDQKRAKGLMGYAKKPENIDGMVFIFIDKQIRYFYNKNTLLDLTIYWMDNEQVIGQTDLPSINKTKDIKIVSSPKPANYVIEIIK